MNNWINTKEHLPEDQDNIVVELISGVLLFGRIIENEFCPYDYWNDRYCSDGFNWREIKCWCLITRQPQSSIIGTKKIQDMLHHPQTSAQDQTQLL